MMTTYLFWLSIALLLSCSWQVDRLPSPAHPEALSLSLDKNVQPETIWLDVQVVDRKTRQVISGLNQKDFLIFEDGKSVPITKFVISTRPLSLAFLIDPNGPAYEINFKQVTLSGLNAGLGELLPGDEVATFQVFPDRIRLAAKFGESRKAGPLETGDTGLDGKFYYDSAVLEVLRYLKTSARPDNRRVLIIYADHSMRDKTPGLTARNVLEEANGSGVVVYWVGCSNCYTPGWFKREPSLGKLERDFNFDKLSPKTLTAVTGGETVSRDRRPERQAETIENILQRLRRHYSIGFTPTTKTSKLRSVQIKLAPHLKDKQNQWVVLSQQAYVPPNPQTAEKP